MMTTGGAAMRAPRRRYPTRVPGSVERSADPGICCVRLCQFTAAASVLVTARVIRRMPGEGTEQGLDLAVVGARQKCR